MFIDVLAPFIFIITLIVFVIKGPGEKKIDRVVYSSWTLFSDFSEELLKIKIIIFRIKALQQYSYHLKTKNNELWKGENKCKD